MVARSSYYSSRGSNRLAWCMVFIFVILFLIFLTATIGLTALVLLDTHFTFGKTATDEDSSQWPEPSGSLLGTFQKAAIATDNGLCSEIGRDMLMKGGNAVDAMIAAMFCIGAIDPQSSGLGGGFFMTIYNSTTRKCVVIDAREVAPETASENMYEKDANASLVGYRAVAVPGQIHGFWNAYQRFGSGNVSWKELVQPSVYLCKYGFPVSREMVDAFDTKKHLIGINNITMSSFINNATGQLYKEGEIMVQPKLASVLDKLASASNPVELFYDGAIAHEIAKEMKEHGGLITANDLKQYKSLIHEDTILNEHLPNGLAMCGPPPPSSFAVTQSIISIIGAFYGNDPDPRSLLNDPLTYHRFIEAMKFGYAQRAHLGDANFVKDSLALARNMTTPEYTNWIKSKITNRAEKPEYYAATVESVPDDHGTSQSSAIDAQGIAVSCTATINRWFGAGRESSHGFMWNNEMDDFSQPNQVNSFGYAPSKSNFIKPGKRPMSSMSPTVVFERESGKVRMVLGASGGSQIISGVAEVAVLSLFFNQTIKEAVDWPRLHNQFSPHATSYESSFLKSILQDLRSRGQNVTEFAVSGSHIQAIFVAKDGQIYANSDFRRRISTYPTGF